LDSEIKETKYCAIKALGFLPELRETSIPKLKQILTDKTLDERIKLELNATLIRLGVDVWSFFKNYFHSNVPKDYLMESVLILGELSELEQAQELLLDIASNTKFLSEIRAAAIWSMGKQTLLQSRVLDFVADHDELVATHAIAIIEKKADGRLTKELISKIGEDHRKNAAIARIISQLDSLNDREIIEAYLNADNPSIKQWLLYSIGLSGKKRFEHLIDELDKSSEKTKSRLQLLWEYHQNWIVREIVDSIEFIKLQN